MSTGSLGMDERIDNIASLVSLPRKSPSNRLTTDKVSEASCVAKWRYEGNRCDADDASSAHLEASMLLKMNEMQHLFKLLVERHRRDVQEIQMRRCNGQSEDVSRTQHYSEFIETEVLHASFRPVPKAHGYVAPPSVDHHAHEDTLDFEDAWISSGSRQLTIDKLTRTEEATQCACGNVFMADAVFCRKCGEKRPELDQAMNETKRKSLLGRRMLPGWTKMDQHVLLRYQSRHPKDVQLDDAGRAPRRSNTFVRSLRKNSFASSSSEFAWLVKKNCCVEILHPQSATRLFWNVISVLMVVYDVLMVPLHAFDIHQGAGLLVMDLVSTLFWSVDIPMCFHTGVYLGPILEMKPRKVACHYIKTWFFVDLFIASAGWAAFISDSAGVQLTKGSLVLKVIRALRLLRVVKVIRPAKMLEERISSEIALLIIAIMKILVGLMVLIHIISCAWYWLGETQSGGWTKADHMVDQDLFYRYFAAARWTIAQICLRTDIELRTAAEYSFTCIVCLVGLVVVSACISQITNVGIELGRLNNEKKHKMRLIYAFINQQHLSDDVSNAVLWYFRQKRSYKRREEQEQRNNLSALPEHLHLEVLYEVQSPVLLAHQLLYDLHVEMPRMAFQIATRVAKAQFFEDTDNVFAQGDISTRMIFMEKGRLIYTQHLSQQATKSPRAGKAFSPKLSYDPEEDEEQPDCDASLSTVVRTGQWMSEPALWVQWETCGSLACKRDSTVLSIEAADFAASITQSTAAHCRAQLYANKLVQTLQSMERLSDLVDPVRSYLHDDP